MSYYDKEGSPIGLMEWATLFEDRAFKKIANTIIGPYHISTIWLGLDHDFGDGPPLIFETMILMEDETDSLCHWQSRYSTLPEAREGHEKACDLVHKKGVTQ